MAPLALAMVISDAVWRDPATGKATILGTFGSIDGSEFPLVFPQMAVYLALTDARGRIPFKLVVTDADEEREPVFVSEFDVDFPDPIEVLELVSEIGEISFPLPGEYRVQLWSRLE